MLMAMQPSRQVYLKRPSGGTSSVSVWAQRSDSSAVQSERPPLDPGLLHAGM